VSLESREMFEVTEKKEFEFFNEAFRICHILKAEEHVKHIYNCCGKIFAELKKGGNKYKTLQRLYKPGKKSAAKKKQRKDSHQEQAQEKRSQNSKRTSG